MSPSSGYVDLLPAIYAQHSFLGRFLLAFEQVLTGRDGEDPPGLEQTIAGIAQLCDPFAQSGFLERLGASEHTRDQFLTWLAGWVALGLRADWSAGQQREFLAQIVRLYRRRGTKDNLAELLRIYTRTLPVITEGDDVPAGLSAPHHFHVTIHVVPDKSEITRMEQIARALIDLQKPAHTTYTLRFEFTTMQIGVRSRIGVDTLLGTVAAAEPTQSPRTLRAHRKKTPAAKKRPGTRRGRT